MNYWIMEDYELFLACYIFAKLILPQVKNNRRLLMTDILHHVILLRVIQFGLGTSVKVHIGIVLLLLSALEMSSIKCNWKSKMMLFGERMQINFSLE